MSKNKNKEMTHAKKLSPLVEESVSGVDGRGKYEQKRKNDGTSELLFSTALNTCLSFLNGRKKRSGIQE